MLAYKLIFVDGYEEVLISLPSDPPIGFTERFIYLVAHHGHPVDFKILRNFYSVDLIL